VLPSRITILRVAHDDQRYDTIGDWQWEGSHLIVRVSNLLDFRSEVAIAIHEVVEALLCEANGISEQQVDEWDLEHEDADDPGSLPGCPYYNEHALATIVERLVVGRLGSDWLRHDEIVAYPRNDRGAGTMLSLPLTPALALLQKLLKGAPS